MSCTLKHISLSHNRKEGFYRALVSHEVFRVVAIIAENIPAFSLSGFVTQASVLVKVVLGVQYSTNAVIRSCGVNKSKRDRAFWSDAGTVLTVQNWMS